MTHTPKKVQKKDCTLRVLSLLKSGVRPSQIWKNHGISERNVKYIMKKLQAVGLVKKLGYGTWEIQEGAKGDPRRCKIIHRVTPTHIPPKGAKPDSIRGHGIVATVKINTKRFINWKNRDIILGARKIPFRTIPQGQRIQVGDVKKVWVTNSSLVFYLPFSWYGDTAPEVAGKILEDVVKLIIRTEKMLGVDTFKIRGNYLVKFSRQHYSLIRNGLAKLYNRDPKRRLFVRDDGGLWLLIDNSYNLEELETVHSDTAKDDNVVVQDFFNSLKKTPITADFVVRALAESATQIKDAHGQIAYYAENLQTHVRAVDNLSSQASENAKTTTSLRDAVERLAQTMQEFPMPVELKARLPGHAKKRVESRVSEQRRACPLCGIESAMKPGQGRCSACEDLVKEWKDKKTRDSTIGEHLI